METCDPIGTQMEIKDKLDLDQNVTLVDAAKYRSMIGALMYLTSSRPDIIHATCLCARSQAKPTEKHLKRGAFGETENFQCVTNDLSDMLTNFSNGFMATMVIPNDRPTDKYQGDKRAVKDRTSLFYEVYLMSIVAASKRHLVARKERITIEEYVIESEVFNFLEIYVDLFTCETPFGIILDEFNQLSGIKEDLFTYEVEVLDPSYMPYVEHQYDNLEIGDLDIYEPRMCYDENDITVEIGDDEEVLTDDELSDLEEENLSEENEIAKIFKIEIDIFDFETPLCKEFKEFNHLLQINIDVLSGDLPGFKTYDNYKMHGFMNGLKKYLGLKKSHEEEESSEDAWSEYLPNDEWEHFERTNHVKTDVNSNHECFDEREPMGDDDDDVRELEDYLILNNAPYCVNEEEERFEERRSKLLGIPYEKPPTFKSEKFEVIKHSFGPAEEYVAIKEYEYDIWVRTKENVSQIY
ncbi:hypothetical protein Tco_0190483 [Tanacetum coccineum]